MNKMNNNPDLIIKKLNFNSNQIAIIFNENMVSSKTINDFILEPLTENNINKKIDNILEYLKTYIPTTKMIEINNYEDLITYLLMVIQLF